MTARFLLLLAAILALVAVPLAEAKEPQYKFVDSPLLKKAPAANDFWMGEANAKVVLIEYASLSCPHCAQFHKNVYPELKKRYIDTRKMLYILRPFPLNEPALKAALLVDCVGEDKGNVQYYNFLRVLFGAQDKWAFEANFRQALETFARVGGVPKDRFDACMADSQREIKLLTIKKEGNKLGVNHTPFFFINGRIYDGDTSAEGMTAYLDHYLGIPHEPVAKKARSKPETEEKPAAGTAQKKN